MVTTREHREAIEELLVLFRYEFYLYSPELFELRIREEKLRADFLHTSFAYLELGFETLFSETLEKSELKPLWRSIMQALHLFVRGSDVKGFLPDNRGLGILFLDTAPAPVGRIFSAVRRHLTSAGLSHCLRKDLKPEEFPTWDYDKTVSQPANSAAPDEPQGEA